MVVYLGTFEVERGKTQNIIFPAKDATTGVPLSGMASNMMGQGKNIHGTTTPANLHFKVSCVASQEGYGYDTQVAPDQYTTGGILHEVSLANLNSYGIINEVGIAYGPILLPGSSPIMQFYMNAPLMAPSYTWTTDFFKDWYLTIFNGSDLESVASSGTLITNWDPATYLVTVSTPIDCIAGDYVKFYNGSYQINLFGAENAASSLVMKMERNENLYIRIDSKDTDYDMEPVEFQLRVNPARDKKLIAGWTPDFENGYLKGRVSAYAIGQLQYELPSATAAHDPLRDLPANASTKVYDSELEVFSSEEIQATTETRDGIFKFTLKPRLRGTTTSKTATTVVDDDSDNPDEPDEYSDLPGVADRLNGCYVSLLTGKYTFYSGLDTVDGVNIGLNNVGAISANLVEANNDGSTVLYVPTLDEWRDVISIDTGTCVVVISSAISGLTTGMTINIGPKRLITDYVDSSQTMTVGTMAEYTNQKNTGEGLYSVARTFLVGETYRVRTRMAWGDEYIESHDEFTTKDKAKLAVKVNEVANADESGNQVVIFVGPLTAYGSMMTGLKTCVATLYNGAGETIGAWSTSSDYTATSPDSYGSWYDPAGGVFHLIKSTGPIAEQDVMQLKVTVASENMSYNEIVSILAISPA